MDWESVQRQLQNILRTPLRLAKLGEREWAKLAGEAKDADSAADAASVHGDRQLYFRLERKSGEVLAFVVEQGALTEAERRLVELVIAGAADPAMFRGGRAATAATEEERLATELGDWIRGRVDNGDWLAAVPDSIGLHESLYETYIPLLLYGEYTGNQSGSYSELKKLLESFFDETILLIPLHDKEWMILAPKAIFAASEGEERDGEPDATEESLASIGSGLYEMLASEWIGECHLAVSYPIVPASELPRTVRDIRETMELGLLFQVSSNLHLPWMLHLERLLHAVPAEDQKRFLAQAIKRIDALADGEMMQTLETFFQLDCNVSETAKKLYIHRNTLLYRLDKFKQETGLDVRTFRQAVIVNLLLVLYKVTKRK